MISFKSKKEKAEAEKKKLGTLTIRNPPGYNNGGRRRRTRRNRRGGQDPLSALYNAIVGKKKKPSLVIRTTK